MQGISRRLFVASYESDTGRLSGWHVVPVTKSSTALFCTFLTLQNNHTGQHAWPDLFLGRWLKGVSWCSRKNSDDDE